MSARRSKRSEGTLDEEFQSAATVNFNKQSGISVLPRLEFLIYAAVAIIFFICYPIYKLYEESQASAYRFYDVLTDGYDVFGGLKDEADFEWNFWRELVTTNGGIIVFVYLAGGRLSELYFPEWRNTVLLLLSMVSLTLLATWQCMLVLLCSASFMYIVSYSKRASVVWVAAIIHLYSITSPFLISYLNHYMKSEFDYHLTIFCAALCNLRFLSFCLDYCRRSSDHSTRFGFLDFLLYIFYFPLFFFGPLMTYKDFHNQVEKKPVKLSSTKLREVLKELFRHLLCIIFIEIVLHFLFFAAYHQRISMLKALPLWALAGNALSHLIFFQLKYQVMFGVPRAVAMLDQVNTYKPPVCILAIFTFVDTWRYFDRGLHAILLNYIYIPVGGSRFGFVRQIFASLLCFVFVFYWHGLESNIFYWALFNWIGVVIETTVNKFLNTEKGSSYLYKFNLSRAGWRRVTAALSTPVYISLSIANLLFLSGINMGSVYFKRLVINSFPTGPLLLLIVYYCMIQLIMECHRKWGKKYLCEKSYY